MAAQGQAGGVPQYPAFFTGELKDLWGELEQQKELVGDYVCSKQLEIMKELNSISGFLFKVLYYES